MIEIQKVTPEDIPTVHAMGENVDEFYTSNQAPNFWPETVLRDCVNKDDVYFFLATTNNEIAGFVIANPYLVLQMLL